MEYRKKCNVCGKIFCYTDNDLKANLKNSNMALLDTLGGIASVFGGTIFHTMYFQKAHDEDSKKVKDFYQCPYCHSRDLSYCSDDEAALETKSISINGGAPAEALLKRAFMFLEDGDWASANAYCEACLDKEPEMAEAYVGKLMAELHVNYQEQLKEQDNNFSGNANYKKAVSYANDALKTTLISYVQEINARNEKKRLEALHACYESAKTAMSNAEYKKAEEKFESIRDYADSAALIQECREKAEELRKDEVLGKAKSLLDGGSKRACEEALPLLTSIADWKNANELAATCEKKLSVFAAEHARQAKRGKRIAVICAAVAVMAIITCIASTKMIAHNKAVTSYNEAEAYLADGDVTHAIGCFRKAGNYEDAKEQSAALIKSISGSISAAAYGQAIGVEKNGTVVAAGSNYSGQCNVSRWADVVAVSTGPDHALGLKANGTVVAAGKNDRGQCNVSSWSDIVAISAGGSFSIGLKSNGRVVAVGYNNDGRCDVANWSDIVAISAGGIHSIGLRADGTVVTSVRNMDGTRFEGQAELKNVSNWANIVAVSAGGYHSLGLKADGTVVATGNREHGQCDVSGWTDIVAVSAGEAHSIGLRADGTVVATGYSKDGQCDVENWSDIVAVSAAEGYTLGLKADGTVVVAGECARGDYGDVSGWTNIGHVNARLP